MNENTTRHGKPTALPSHHHRVQGRLTGVGTGHASGSDAPGPAAVAAPDTIMAEPAKSRKKSVRGVVGTNVVGSNSIAGCVHFPHRNAVRGPNPPK